MPSLNNQQPVQHDLALKISLAAVANSCSALATSLSCTAVHTRADSIDPFDLVKIRQQLQDDARSSTNAIRWLTDVVKYEGFFGLWKGVGPSVGRDAVYSGIRFGSYDFFKSLFTPNGQEENLVAKFGGGLSSGLTGSMIASPFDLVKIRMQAQGNRKTLVEHYRLILQSDGVRGLYRGVGPTACRAGVLTSVQLGSYDQAKIEFQRLAGIKEGFGLHLLAAGTAGFTATAASAPIDVVKSRLMRDKRYKSSSEIIIKVLRQEGALAFYKGGVMAWLRLWPHSIISLSIFEQLRRLSGLNPIGTAPVVKGDD